MQYISSSQNALIKELVKLSSSKKEREQSGLFVLETHKLICDFAISGGEIEALFTTENALQKSDKLNAVAKNAAQVFEITEQVSQKLSAGASSQGVFALCKMAKAQADFSPYPNGKYILLERMQDPGNVGAVIRTAAAFGVGGVILSPDSADVYSPKVLRSAMGGMFSLPVITADICRCIADMRKIGMNVYAAALDKNAITIGQANFTGGCAVVIGNEGVGLDKQTIAACTGSVIIPIAQNTDSLNAAVAAGIFLWNMSGK